MTWEGIQFVTWVVQGLIFFVVGLVYWWRPNHSKRNDALGWLFVAVGGLLLRAA